MSGSTVEFVNLFLRQVTETDPAIEEAEEVAPECGGANAYDGRMGLRISAVFVILTGSTFGALFPVIAKQHPGLNIPNWAFFFTRYFGSGVIIATAFIHLLTPANEALTNGCLTGPITEYPWAQGIALMSVFSLFFVELLALRLGKFSAAEHDHEHGLANLPATKETSRSSGPEDQIVSGADPESLNAFEEKELRGREYAAQLLSIFILEFGVIFHSIFIGLTLAVSGEEFITLYIVLVFHQTFEGLGLGSRLSSVPFPNKWTPYLMGVGYGISTPIAIAVGLGLRATFEPETQTALIVNGVFDAISAGILLYTGLVELMAHEFLFGKTLRDESMGKVLCAFGYMVLGAALMALLGKWA
ncbi:Zinc/iron permease [Morchella snyderi]|nr:Zinc/iron permease [Morchella snyderi]